jgi:hypothetical protein
VTDDGLPDVSFHDSEVSAFRVERDGPTLAEYLLNIHNRLTILMMMPVASSAAPQNVQGRFREEWLPRLRKIALAQGDRATDEDRRSSQRHARKLLELWGAIEAGDTAVARRRLEEADAIRLFPKGHG